MEKSPLLLVLLLSAVAFVHPACTTCAPRSVRVGLDQVFYVIRGEGKPTVVLEADVGDGTASWNPVIAGIASTTTTFAYDRPGYAPASVRHRPSATGWHTPDDAATRLRRLLRAVGVSPPYVLVGHGAGGTYALEYAVHHPEEVAGIVLVQRRLPRFRDECRRAGLAPGRPPGPWAGRLPRHQREEIRGLRIEAAARLTGADLGDIPVTVIAAGGPPDRATDPRQILWIDLQRRFAEEATDGRFVLAEGSGHHVQRDDPALLIREVRSLLERSAD